MERETVSVVIPVYNRERLIGRAIESALRQSTAPDEIIVVDDGSTDGTGDVIAGYDVTYIRQDNTGAPGARNHGVRIANGRWIAFLDSDDYWFDDHLERMVAAVAGTGGRAVLYFSDVVRTKAEGLAHHWDRCSFSIDGPFEFTEDPIALVGLPRQPQMIQASLIDRRTYLDIGGIWDQIPRCRYDNHLFFRLAFAGPICAVAGLGAQMTDDDQPENRAFGGAIRPGTMAYETESCLMYGDLVKLSSDQPGEVRRLMRRRLKAAHFSMARLHRAEGNWWPAIRHGVRGVAASPRHTAISLLARVRLADREAA